MIMNAKFYGNDEKIQKQQLEMISMLNRWYQVKEDLLFAFEKCGESQIGEPTRSRINNFVVRIRGGLSIEKSLELFAGEYHDRQFKNFAAQIRFNLKYRGNIGELLDNMETQLIQIDQERTRRKIASSRERMLLKIIFIICPILSIIVILSNQSAKEIFIEEPIGKFLISVGLICYIIGLLIYKTSSVFNEDI